MVLKHKGRVLTPTHLFENDVEMYGAQTVSPFNSLSLLFENDVEMYGAQTKLPLSIITRSFENDVEMYGAQTS